MTALPARLRRSASGDGTPAAPGRQTSSRADPASRDDGGAAGRALAPDEGELPGGTVPRGTARSRPGLRSGGRSGVWSCREFGWVWAATAVTLLGNELARVALVVLVYARTGSAPAAAAGYAVTLLPAAVGGPTLSRLADRLPRRRLMVCCDLAAAALTAATALPHLPLGAVFGLAFAVGTLATPYEAARAATIAGLFADRPATYTASSTVTALTVRAAQVIGYAGGGLLVAVLGARAALLVDAATFLVSAGIVRAGMTDRPAASTGPRAGQWADLKAGLRPVFGDPELRIPLLYGWLAAFFVTPSAIVAPLAAAHGGGPVAVGVLLTASAGATGICVLASVGG
jgi:MFS family permease